MRKLIALGLFSLCCSAVLLCQAGCGGDATNSNATSNASTTTNTTSTPTGNATSTSGDPLEGQPFISGTVTDKSGRGIPNAQITAVNSETNAPMMSETDSNGFYYTRRLRAGRYRVTASAQGFVTQEKSAYAAPGDSVTLDFVLGRR